jgi:hypothetical protein
MILINKMGRSGYDPERPVWSPLSFKLPMPLALAIVLLAGDMARRAMLCRANPGSLSFRHNAIGLCPVFHLVDAFLLPVQPVCFSLVQLPALNPLIDPLLLIGLPFIDDRRIRLRVSYAAHQDGHHRNC